MNVRSKAVLIVLLALTPGNGVVFILNAGTTDEARTLLEDLPLSKAKILRFQTAPPQVREVSR